MTDNDNKIYKKKEYCMTCIEMALFFLNVTETVST